MCAKYESLGCLQDMFWCQAKKTPEALAIVTDEGTKMTLGEVDRLTDRLAQVFMLEYKVTVGDSVGIYMEKSTEFVLAYIAALKAGAAYFPLDVSYPYPLLTSILEESQPPVVCTKPNFASGLTDNVPRFLFDENWQERISNICLSGAKWPKTTMDDLAYLVYSSGTTGKPKGICCPHRGAVFSYTWRHEHYPFDPDERVACNVFFVWEQLRSILKGIPLYIVPDDVIYEPNALCSFFQRHQITQMLFTPSLLQTVLDTVKGPVLKKAFQSFRKIWLCGEVVTVSLMKQIVGTIPWVQILNLYSISECHDVAASDLTSWYQMRKSELETGKSTTKFVPAGQLLPGVDVVIMDDNFNQQPIGVSGEIYVGGPTLALGYFKRPDLNETRFITSPVTVNGKENVRLYKTGDWGFLLSDGKLEICGRCDSMVKIRGYSVEMQAIENTLMSLQCVNTCAVVAQGQEGEDKHVVAYVILQEKMSRKDLRAALKRRLPFYMIPSYFVYLDRLPLLAASSKVDKRALPAVDETTDIIEVESLPKTVTEKELAEIWMEILNLKAIDIQESFFDLGGHSLLAARLLNRVSDNFGKRLTMQDLFQNPTVESFSKFLGGATGEESKLPVLDLAAEVDKHDLKDVVMDLYLRAFWRSLRWGDRWKKGCVLLTGATGFVGSFLLRELLMKSELQVICLVRETANETPEERISRILQSYGLLDAELEVQLNQRVTIFKGDVTLKSMGLNEDDYHFLSYDVDCVIHAAAYVNLIYPYEALHGCNVLGTQNVLMFCYTNKIKPLHYISSNAVIPSCMENVSETDSVSELWSDLKDGYSQSKWVAERLVSRAVDRGFPAVIYRLGNQAGPCDGSAWNVQDYTYLIWYGCAVTGYAPRADWDLELTPVDFTAQIIVAAVTQHFGNCVGKVYHLTAGRQEMPKWQQVGDWMKRAGYNFHSVDYKEWIEKIGEALASKESDKNLQLLDRLLDTMIRDEKQFATLSTYERRNVDELLGNLGWKYPVIDEKQFTQWIKAMSAHGLMPKPATEKRKPLQGKVAIVTGASAGIGAAVARSLALDGGARVVLAARRVDKLHSIKNELKLQGGEAAAVRCDVTDRGQVKELVKEAERVFGSVDILVNSAGVMYYTMMKNLHEDQWEHQIDLNCKGTVNTIGAVLNGMCHRKSGHIVNITSDAGRKAFPGLAVYSGTKFFVEGMSSALRQEMAEFGVKVTNVQPGDVSTELLAHSSDAEAVDKFDGSGGGHKILDAQDIGRAVLYALSQPENVGVNEILIEPTAAPI